MRKGDRKWREALYRQLARQPGLPQGLRPLLVTRAERCAGMPSNQDTEIIAPRNVEGCKGAVGR